MNTTYNNNKKIKKMKKKNKKQKVTDVAPVQNMPGKREGLPIQRNFVSTIILVFKTIRGELH